MQCSLSLSLSLSLTSMFKWYKWCKYLTSPHLVTASSFDSLARASRHLLLLLILIRYPIPLGMPPPIGHSHIRLHRGLHTGLLNSRLLHNGFSFSLSPLLTRPHSLTLYTETNSLQTKGTTRSTCTHLHANCSPSLPKPPKTPSACKPHARQSSSTSVVLSDFYSHTLHSQVYTKQMSLSHTHKNIHNTHS